MSHIEEPTKFPQLANLSRRSLLGLGGSLSAGLLLSACGGNSAGGSTGGSANSSAAGSTNSSAGGAAGSSGGTSAGVAAGSSAQASVKSGSTITVWDPTYKAGQPTFDKSADAIDKLFTEKFGVTVNHQAQPFADYDKLLQAAFTGRTGPDVTLMLPGSQGVLRWKKGLTDLTPGAQGLRDQLKFWDATSPSFTATGNTYGIPIDTVGLVFYYNKKIFRAAGLDPEVAPATFAELTATADKLKAKGIVPFASGNKEGYENQWWLSILWSGSQSVADSVSLAKREIPLDDPRFGDVLQKYNQLQQAGYFSSNRFSAPLFTDGVAAFSQGKGAMFLGLSSSGADWSVFNKALGQENVGYFQAPGIGKAKADSLPVTASYVWSSPSFSSNVDAARAYVLFTGSTEAQQIQYDTAKLFPNNKNVKLTGAAPQLVGMFKDFQSRPVFEGAHQLLPGTVLTQYTTLTNEYLQGRTALTDMLKQLQATNKRAN